MVLMAVLIVAILVGTHLATSDVANDLAQGKYDLDGSDGSKLIFLKCLIIGFGATENDFFSVSFDINSCSMMRLFPVSVNAILATSSYSILSITNKKGPKIIIIISSEKFSLGYLRNTLKNILNKLQTCPMRKPPKLPGALPLWL